MGLSRPVQHLCAAQHRDSLQADRAGPGVVLHQPHFHHHNVHVRLRRPGGHLNRRRAASGLLPQRHPDVELLHHLLQPKQQRAGRQRKHLRQSLLPQAHHPAGRNDLLARHIRHPTAVTHCGIRLLRHHRRTAVSAIGAADVPHIPDTDSPNGHVVGTDHLVHDREIPRPQHACGLRNQPLNVRHTHHLPDEPHRQQKLRMDHPPQSPERRFRVVALFHNRHWLNGLDGTPLLCRLSLRHHVHRPPAVLQSRAQLYRHRLTNTPTFSPLSITTTCNAKH